MIIYRDELDIKRLWSIVTHIVNAANTVGAMGKGIALMIREEYTDTSMYMKYREACDDKTFSVENPILLFETPDYPKRPHVIHLATKDHWADTSSLDLIEKSLIALREYLMPRPHIHIAMPMLGCGYGGQDYDTVLPLFHKHLDDLPNLVHLSMRPDYFTTPLRYMAIVGPRTLDPADAPLDILQRYDDLVMDSVSHWGLTLEDIHQIVSGGAKGIDSYAAGRSYMDPSYHTSFSVRYHPRRPLIIPAEWGVYGKSAGWIRNKVMADIATHVVVFKKDHSTSPGTQMMLDLIKNKYKHQPRRISWAVHRMDNHTCVRSDFYPEPEEI